MMFLEFFIWGVWFVTLGIYLSNIGFTGIEIGSAYSTVAWAAVISAFFVSLVADKYFSAEKLNGILHLVGGVLMYYASTIHTPQLFFWVLLAYALCYSPTLALTTAIGMQHCPEPGKQFPVIRVFGTLGWIVAGISISVLNIEGGPEPMWLAAICSIILGLYSFTLPKTPPRAKGKSQNIKEVLGLDALKLMKNRSFATLSITALLITIPFAMYHAVTNMSMNEMGVENVAGKMTLAQMSEAIFMLMIPFLYIRLGVKKMLMIGLITWSVRYALFAYGSSEVLIAFYYIGILLHGVCYDFFFVTAQLYMDERAPRDLRSSVQGFFVFLTWGVGWLIGSYITGILLQVFEIQDATSSTVRYNWPYIMLVPAVLSLIVAIFFGTLFRDEKLNAEEPAENQAAE